MGWEENLMRRSLALTFGALLLAVGIASAADLPLCRYGVLPAPNGANRQAQPLTAHQLAVFYAVPNDIPFNPAVLARIKQATADIQAWYQCATGGVTWEIAFPET